MPDISIAGFLMFSMQYASEKRREREEFIAPIVENNNYPVL
jgi:hypothetical protein